MSWAAELLSTLQCLCCSNPTRCAGRVRLHVGSTFPLSEIRAAHERLEAGEQLRKVVLTIP